MPTLIDISFQQQPPGFTINIVKEKFHTSLEYMNFLPDDFKAEVILFTERKEKQQINKVSFKCFKKTRLFFLVVIKAAFYIRKATPGYILVQGFIFPLQTLLLRFFTGSNTKILIQHHGESPFKGIKRWLQKIACKNCNAFLFTAKGNAEEWLKNGLISTPEKIYELPEASTGFVKLDKLKCKQQLGFKGNNNFLWVGRLNPGKDPLTAITAFNELSKTHPDVRLYMIYQTEELLPEIKKNLSVNIILVGSVPHSELQYWYSATDFFISTSHKEGSGYALIEAMACGCIPVVTNIPPYEKLCGGNGFLFEKGNAGDLLNKMKISLSCNREQMSAAVENNFKQNLTYKKIAETLENILQTV